MRKFVTGLAVAALLFVGCVEGPDVVLCQTWWAASTDSDHVIRVEGRYLVDPVRICGERALTTYAGSDTQLPTR
jgi:hypothetical protein